MLIIETLNRISAEEYIKAECAENGWNYTVEHSKDGVILTWTIDRHGDNRDMYFDRDYYWLVTYEDEAA